MYIARSSPELSAVLLDLELVQDELWLAEDGSFGTLAEVRSSLLEHLEQSGLVGVDGLEHGQT
jgi:hypothetical protein